MIRRNRRGPFRSSWHCCAERTASHALRSSPRKGRSSRPRNPHLPFAFSGSLGMFVSVRAVEAILARSMPSDRYGLVLELVEKPSLKLRLVQPRTRTARPSLEVGGEGAGRGAWYFLERTRTLSKRHRSRAVKQSCDDRNTWALTRLECFEMVEILFFCAKLSSVQRNGAQRDE